MSYNELRKRCKARGLSPCSGKGITKAYLSKLLSDADTRPAGSSPPTDRAKAEQPMESPTKTPPAQQAPRRKPKKSPKSAKTPPSGKALQKKSGKSPDRKKGKQKRRKSSGEPSDRYGAVLRATRPAELDAICDAHDCSALDWRRALQEKFPSIAGAIARSGGAPDPRAVYKQTLAFKERFRTTNDFQNVNAAQMSSFPVVWPAMVGTYPRMREIAAKVGDLDTLEAADLSRVQKAEIYVFSGTREVADWLLVDLDAAVMGKDLLKALRLCNEIAANVLLDAGVVYDVRMALEAALACPGVLKRLLGDIQHTTHIVPTLLAKAYAEGQGDVLALIVLELPQEELHQVLIPHLMLLARENMKDALARVLPSKGARVLASDLQRLFVEAIERNAVDVVKYVRKFDTLRYEGLLRKAASMNRTKMLGLIYVMLPEGIVCSEVADALVEARKYRADDAMRLLESWEESCK